MEILNSYNEINTIALVAVSNSIFILFNIYYISKKYNEDKIKFY